MKMIIILCASFMLPNIVFAMDEAGADEFIQRLWDLSVEEGIIQRAERNTLRSTQYEKILNETAFDADLKCGICLEKALKTFGNKLRGGIVQLNCGGKQGHIFCKDCIEESYKYRKNCPVCRQQILSNNLITLIQLFLENHKHLKVLA